MITVKPDARLSILHMAARLTTARHDPVAVAVNAGALLAWVEDASEDRDARARLDAMKQHSHNLQMTRLNRDEHPEDDNPEELLRGAKFLYSFAVAGEA